MDFIGFSLLEQVSGERGNGGAITGDCFNDGNKCGSSSGGGCSW
ncbi:hypothetical protein FHU10_4552 [Serratia fonticola]|uniref:Uncharacterized protein n=1 Tax=Serratia fonticola TaxID=47917 RepID=A0A542BPU5_SERFO|nr:hypothetical protein FHU09_3152 [Serratia fonticola]TQI97400.1 hypothetical protein FHU11_2893 [Serratia fonticola]TVZ71896.1 hypothetical protein FHU10_4552 [Serratia fonticola]